MKWHVKSCISNLCRFFIRGTRSKLYWSPKMGWLD